MKKRIIATATMLSILLALFIVMPGGIAMAEEYVTPEDEPIQITSNEENSTSGGGSTNEAGPQFDPIVLASSVLDNQNPGSEEVPLRLTFLNVSNSVLRDIQITLTGFMSSVITLPSSEFTQSLGDLWPGQQGTLVYNVVVSGNVGTGPNQLNVKIDYIDAEYKPQIVPAIATVNIVRPLPPEPEPPEPPPEPPTPIPPGVPRVIISRQQLSVDNVIAGTPFDLTITLLNTSRNRNVRNMEVTITDAEGVFVPVIGVNSFFVETLNSQETTDIVISLMARQDTETGSHPITVTINYEDNLNAPHSTAPTINIPVYLPVRIEVENLSFDDEGQGAAFLSFQVINMSLAPLSNVSVRLEGPFMADQFQVEFFGTMAPGSFEFYEDSIFPFEFGEVSGEIVLEFEDSSGAPGEMRIPISTWISEPFFPDFDGGDRWPPDGEIIWEEEFPENGTMGWFLWAIIGGAVLLAGIITIIVVRRVKRKKREAADFGDD